MSVPSQIEWKRRRRNTWTVFRSDVLAVISTIMAAALYLNSTLHQMDIRLTRIETKLGIDEPAVSVSQR